MASSSKKWIAAIVLVLIAALIVWRMQEKPASPPVIAALAIPNPTPLSPPTSPIASEARPAPPLETAKKPLAPSPKPVVVPKKISATKKISVAAPAAQPIAQAHPVVQIPPAIAPLPIPPPAPEPVEWMGNDTSVTHEGQVVIRSDHQWISFWAEHHPHEAAPDVDFTHSMVVGVFAGPRPADQFTIRLVAVRTLPGSLTVDYQEKLPPPGTFAVDVTVYPYHLKVIPLSTMKVKFNRLAPIDPNR